MGLESASFLDDLNASFPEGTDQRSQGDNHIRLIKAALKATFPDADKAFYFPKAGAAETTNQSPVAALQGSLILMDASSGALTVNLPASPGAGAEFIVMKTDASVNAVTIDPNSTDTINGASTLLLRWQYSVARCRWNGTAWFAEVIQRPFDSFATLTENTTLSILHHRMMISANGASAGFTVTLPGSPVAGYKVRILKSDSSANVIAVTDSVTTVNLYIQNEFVDCIYNGSAWLFFPELWSANADVWAGNVDRGLRASDIVDSSVIQAISFAAPIAWSWTGGFVREVTFTDDGTLDNPTGGIPGTFRSVVLKGSSSTERVLSFGNQFLGTLPEVIDITDTRWYLITIFCYTTSHFGVVGIATIKDA